MDKFGGETGNGPRVTVHSSRQKLIDAAGRVPAVWRIALKAFAAHLISRAAGELGR